MSNIQKFSLSINDIELTSDRIESLVFNLKLLDDNNRILCAFSIDGDGISYTDRRRQKPSGFLSMKHMKVLFDALLETELIDSFDDSSIQISTFDNQVIIRSDDSDTEREMAVEDTDSNTDTINNKSNPIWKRLERITVEDYEAWLRDLKYNPYIYDPVLQSISWITNLTQAIQRVQQHVGHAEADSLYFVDTYWENLSSWEFILNSLSIARAVNLTINKPNSWEDIITSLKFWVDNLRNHAETLVLVNSGTDYFCDMSRFFYSDRRLSNPVTLYRNVLDKVTPKDKTEFERYCASFHDKV
jgi:hypothetical protein